MSKIKVLSTLVANQIAAGEVVERPASIVKELVENSLDAGATTIVIDIEKGGKSLIRIRDNGCGIAKEELDLALTPHATSKLSSLDDLNSIISYGFRGEALASIGSVSKLSLISRTPEAESGWKIYNEGKDYRTSSTPIAHPQGTTIEVAELFYNTPARRNFLKSDNVEFNHIEDLIKRLAIARPHVDWTLTHNGKQRLRYPGLEEGNFKERVMQVLPKAFGERSVILRAEVPTFNLKMVAVVNPGSFTTNNSMTSYSYINQRMIKDKILISAIKQAFTELYQHVNLNYVLFLEIDPASVDVNVHPAKAEVRFVNAHSVHSFIFQNLFLQLAKVQGLDPRKTQLTIELRNESALLIDQEALTALGEELAQQEASYSKSFDPRQAREEEEHKATFGARSSKEGSSSDFFNKITANIEVESCPASTFPTFNKSILGVNSSSPVEEEETIDFDQKYFQGIGIDFNIKANSPITDINEDTEEKTFFTRSTDRYRSNKEHYKEEKLKQELFSNLGLENSNPKDSSELEIIFNNEAEDSTSFISALTASSASQDDSLKIDTQSFDPLADNSAPEDIPLNPLVKAGLEAELKNLFPEANFAINADNSEPEDSEATKSDNTVTNTIPYTNTEERAENNHVLTANTLKSEASNSNIEAYLYQNPEDIAKANPIEYFYQAKTATSSNLEGSALQVVKPQQSNFKPTKISLEEAKQLAINSLVEKLPSLEATMGYFQSQLFALQQQEDLLLPSYFSYNLNSKAQILTIAKQHTIFQVGEEVYMVANKDLVTDLSAYFAEVELNSLATDSETFARLEIIQEFFSKEVIKFANPKVMAFAIYTLEELGFFNNGEAFLALLTHKYPLI